MFKRISLIGVLAGMVLIVAACGSKSASSEIKVPEQPTQVASAPAAPVEEKKVEAKPAESKAPAVTPAPVQSTPTPALSAAPVDEEWKAGIVAIAKSQKSETEKFDEVTKIARAYKPNDATLKDFETFIVSEFKSGAYLKSVKNHEYMLNNIFKSTVIERHYDDKQKQPIDTFALDFLQNTKYTYRGESITSDSVKTNESQMKKALEKIK